MMKPITMQHHSLQSLISIFKTISYHSDDVYWIGIPDFKHCLYVSLAYEKVWGQSCESLLKNIKTWNKYLYPQDLKNYHPLLEMLKKIKQEGPKARYEEKYRIISQQGEVKWIEDRGQPLYDKNGQYIGVCGVARDVTCKKIIAQYTGNLWTCFPKNTNNKNRYYLKGHYKNIYLTSREAECAFYLLKGKTSKETARILHISYRTVEDIVQKIKTKLNVSYRSELFNVLIESYFLAD